MTEADIQTVVNEIMTDPGLSEQALLNEEAIMDAGHSVYEIVQIHVWRAEKENPVAAEALKSANLPYLANLAVVKLMRAILEKEER